MGPSSPVTEWVIRHGFPHDIDVLSDTNGDGVSLLMAYALNLNPARIRSGDLPQARLGTNQLLFTFYAGGEGIAYAVETSTDLREWTTEDVVISDPDEDGFRTASIFLSPTCSSRIVPSRAAWVWWM